MRHSACNSLVVTAPAAAGSPSVPVQGHTAPVAASALVNSNAASAAELTGLPHVNAVLGMYMSKDEVVRLERSVAVR